MYKNNSLISEILKARENRAQQQKKILATYQTSLISYTLNIPGPNKNTEIYKQVHIDGRKALLEGINKTGKKIIYQESRESPAGMETFVCVDMDQITLKKLTVSIEELHPLGRLFDFDVFDKSGNSISRIHIHADERKCLLCGEKAPVCGRSRKHPLDLLLKFIDQMIRDFYFTE